MLASFYSDEFVTIYHGDCRVIWPQLARADLLLTDPPYGCEYNAAKQNLRRNKTYANIAGDGDVDLARFAMSMLWNVSHAVVFGANYFPHLLPHRGRWICWDKRTCEEADKAIGSPFELAWMNKRDGYDKIIRKMHGGWINADGGKRVHPTQKPSGLFCEIINDVFPDVTTVIDPFMGSGSVLLAAKRDNRRAIGIELDEKYCEAAADRLRQGVFNFAG